MNINLVYEIAFLISCIIRSSDDFYHIRTLSEVH